MCISHACKWKTVNTNTVISLVDQTITTQNFETALKMSDERIPTLRSSHDMIKTIYVSTPKNNNYFPDRSLRKASTGQTLTHIDPLIIAPISGFKKFLLKLKPKNTAPPVIKYGLSFIFDSLTSSEEDSNDNLAEIEAYNQNSIYLQKLTKGKYKTQELNSIDGHAHYLYKPPKSKNTY